MLRFDFQQADDEKTIDGPPRPSAPKSGGKHAPISAAPMEDPSGRGSVERVDHIP